MPDTQFALIGRANSARVLLMRENDSWTLPRHNETAASEIARAIKQALQLDVVVLGPVYDRYEWLQDDQQAIYAAELRHDGWLPPDAQWFDAEALTDLPLVVPEHRAIIINWLAELAGASVAPERAPWMCLGWFDGANAWITEQLAAHGEALSAPIEQFRVGTTSCLLRATTERGTHFFKVSGPASGFEARLTEALAQRWPDQMPRLLAADAGRNWLLLDDLGPTLRSTLDGKLDLERSAEVLGQYIRLQHESAAEHELLLAAGLPDRRLEHLPALFDAAVADTSGFLIDHDEGISSEVYQQLCDFRPQVADLCQRLAAYGMPQTIHHDDFHEGNIAINPAKSPSANDPYIFFDWGECALTHPLCTLLLVQRTAKYLYKADDAMLDRLRDIYLEAWSDVAPFDQLQEMWPLARQLGALHRALSWHAAAVAAEPALRPPLASGASYWFQIFMSNDLP